MSDIATLLDDFSLFDDWEDRYRYVIDLGAGLEPLSEEERVEANKVQGCISQVWFVTAFDKASGTIHFRGDSDSHIVKGLIAVLFAIYNDKRPDEIISTDIEQIFKQLELEEHLSPNRRNGFYAMVERIRKTAQFAENQ